MKKKEFRIARTLGTAAAAAWLSACALTTDRIDLAYTVPTGIQAEAGAPAVQVDVQVTDQRIDKTKVSSKKNGFGAEMAPILANEDVNVTVRRAIEQNLAARGFKLGASPTSVQIAAGLTRFYNDHKPGFFAGDAVADLNLAVTVRARDGSVAYTRQLVAQGTEPNIQLMTGDNARLALNRALENGMKQLFEDRAFIAALLGRKLTADASAL